MGSLSRSSSATSRTKRLKSFAHSVWLFPIILLIPVLVFTSLKISGSSIGFLHNILYGSIEKDPNLLAGEPRAVRSDEWLVTTQQTIIQAKDNFPRINKDIGNGQDMTTLDVPSKDWSTVFKPHDLIFFILPLENAFAFKWWIMGYLLIISCYFFVLALLPTRKLLAISLSLALFFSAFVQWWYAYGTLGSLYYSLFIATLVIYLLRQNQLKKKILLGALIAYMLVCLFLVLYPPFQIACGLVLFVFLIGYVLQVSHNWRKKELIQNALVIGGSGLIAIAIVGAFIFSRYSVIKATENTAYPGQRVIKSGGVYPYHFMSSNLGYQFISDKNSAYYLIDGKNPSNQSETSNFLLLTPFLFIPSLALIYVEKKRREQIDWTLLLLNILFVIFLLELFVPGFTDLSKLFLLDKVGSGRLLIGVGLMNLMILVLFVRNLLKKKFSFPTIAVILYSLIVLIVELVVSLHAFHAYHHFIRLRLALLFSLPLPIVVYLLLKKRFTWAILIYFAFSLLIGFGVNPLYKGLSVLTENPISTAIQKVGFASTKRWATDGGYLENIALVNGKPSVSGVYNYPQFSLWDTISGAKKFIYNRYAHVGFEVLDDPGQTTKLSLLESDSFTVETSSCSNYLQSLNVGFLVTATFLKDRCIKLDDTISFPYSTVYIYTVEHQT